MIKTAGEPNSSPPAAGCEARPFSVRAESNRQMLPIPASGRDTASLCTHAHVRRNGGPNEARPLVGAWELNVV
jgi:hypothetical protein